MSFSIVIPSRNADNLSRCVDAIYDAGETTRIIVVWDGDGPLRVGMNAPWTVPERGVIEVVRGEKPFCYARNINIGICAAGDDDVILLNDDALLKTTNGFTDMSIACSVQGWGMLGAVTNAVGNPNQLRSAPLPSEMWTVREEPRQLCFVCVYIPRSTISAVGMLDERYVDYGLDDDDYSLRVRRAGLRLGVYDGCFVDHGSLASSFRAPGGRGGDFSANMRRFIEKHGIDNWNQPRETSQFAKLFPPL